MASLFPVVHPYSPVVILGVVACQLLPLFLSALLLLSPSSLPLIKINKLGAYRAIILPCPFPCGAPLGVNMWCPDTQLQMDCTQPDTVEATLISRSTANAAFCTAETRATSGYLEQAGFLRRECAP